MATKMSGSPAGVRDRHKDLKFILLIAVTCISIVPTTLLAILSYYQYRNLLQEEQNQFLKVYANNVRQMLSPQLLLSLNPKSVLKKEISVEKTLENDTASPYLSPQILYDACVVDDLGDLLTASRFFTTEDRENLRKIITAPSRPIEKFQTFRGEKLWLTAQHLQLHNMTLLVARQAPVATWFRFQFKLVAIYCACTAIGLLLIHQLITILTRKLRESDIQRMKIFSDIAHTHRLTTLGTLAAGVAHEINNPLASLHQRAGLLLDIFDMNKDFPQRDKVLKTTENMIEHISRCQIITHQLLVLSQEKPSVGEQTSIENIISELLVFFQAEAEQRHIVFETNFDKQLPNAHGAEDKIQQVLLTIITNAMTALEENGIIRITTKTKDSDYIKINIEDNGRGIPPNTLKHIYDPFFTTKDTGEGTGLGLAIANALIKSLGGEITIESTPEKGTLFSIILLKHIPDENTNN